MSDYFDGLMRSSGLPLGLAPVTGPMPRIPAAAITEIEETPTAKPADTPPAISAASNADLTRMPAANVRSAPRPPPDASPVATARADDPASPAPPVDAIPDPETVRMSGQVDAPASRDQPRTEPATDVPAELRPAITRERVIQAAMRWVAGEPARPVTVPTRNEIAVHTTDPAASAPEDAVLPRPPATANVIAQPTEPPLALIAAKPVASPVETAAVARHQPRAEETIQVSIGAINLTVEAPARPALTTAPAPRPAAKAPAPPRSGLSRRALRGI